MRTREYVCLDCDKLFHPCGEKADLPEAQSKCPVCGSMNVEPLPLKLEEFLEENFGEIA